MRFPSHWVHCGLPRDCGTATARNSPNVCGLISGEIIAVLPLLLEDCSAPLPPTLRLLPLADYTSHSTRPRIAPSRIARPRIPPDAQCAGRRWQDVTYAIAARPTLCRCARSMSARHPRGKLLLWGRWGALSLRSATTLPALLARLLPLRRATCIPLQPARRSPDSRVC